MLYAINPKQLDRFRDRFSPAGAKDDRRDARVLADSLRTDGQSFRQVQVQSALVTELREWSRMAEELQQERNGLTNRMGQQLRRYYPQMLELVKGNNGKDIDAPWFLVFPASRCLQTTPSSAASTCLARVPVSASGERRWQRRNGGQLSSSSVARLVESMMLMSLTAACRTER